MENRNIEQLKKSLQHWSYSAFNTYLQCPLKYRFRYIDNIEPERTGSCFPFGCAIHSALSYKARENNKVGIVDVQECFADCLKAELSIYDNVKFKEGEDYDTLLATGNRMLEAAVNEWKDDYAVKSVAESFCVDVPGLSKQLVGEFDCVVTDGGMDCIVDWKTASAKWPTGKADRDLQATVFCYAYQQKYSQVPMFRFDVITKAKSPTISSYYTVRTQDELDRFIYTATAIDKAVQNGDFYPNDSSFGCTDCPYADHCKKIARTA